MTNEKKTPQAEQWWVNSSGKIRYIIGVKLCGSIVYEDFTGLVFSNGRSDWSNWHHEPCCTGFDWTDPPAIDPGDGWELLPVGTVLQDGDEYLYAGVWIRSIGEGIVESNTYRRRKPPAEVWPKYYICDTWVSHAYITRDSAGRLTSYFFDGRRDCHTRDWDETDDDNVSDGIWREVTEAEALARVKTAEAVNPATKALHELAIDAGIDPLGLDPADIAEKMIAKQQVTGCSGESPDSVPENRPAREVIREIVRLIADSSMTDEESADMAFQIGKQWLDDNPEDPAPFAKPFTDARSGMGIRKDAVAWRPNSGQYDAATDVKYESEKPVESPDDWVTQDRVPARPGIDERRYHYSSGDISAWADSACMDWNRPVMNRAPLRNTGGWVELRCRRKDLPAKQSACTCQTLAGVQVTCSSCPAHGLPYCELITPAPQPKTMDVSPGEGWRWVEKDEPWQEGDDCLICDFKHAHTHNCQCWRRRIAPQPKRTPVRLWCLKNCVQNVGSGVIACVEKPDSGCDMWQEIKFDGSGFYVEGIE